MRCPHCRKKVHPDDIYCVFCGASLRGKSPADPWNCICADEETHRTHAPRRPSRNSGPRRPVLLIVLLTVLVTLLPGILAGGFFALEAVVDEIHTLAVAPQPEPVAPEDAWKLGTVIARWEDFTVTANYAAMNEFTGELELVCTAENQTDHTIVVSDAAVTVEGYDLTALMYLELSPGERVADYLWIDTAAMQAVDISRIQELSLCMSLMDGEDDTLLAVTDPAALTVDFALPDITMHRGKTTLIETEELTVTLAGWQQNPDFGELTLYTLIENHSAENASVFMEEARCGEADLHLYGYYEALPGKRLLCRDILYDVPFSGTAPTEITFCIRTQNTVFDTAAGKTVISLAPDGSSGTIRSEWE